MFQQQPHPLSRNDRSDCRVPVQTGGCNSPMGDSMPVNEWLIFSASPSLCGRHPPSSNRMDTTWVRCLGRALARPGIPFLKAFCRLARPTRRPQASNYAPPGDLGRATRCSQKKGSFSYKKYNANGHYILLGWQQHHFRLDLEKYPDGNYQGNVGGKVSYRVSSFHLKEKENADSHSYFYAHFNGGGVWQPNFGYLKQDGQQRAEITPAQSEEGYAQAKELLRILSGVVGSPQGLAMGPLQSPAKNPLG